MNNSYVTYGNGTTNCSLAATGTPCRQVPDISANADEYTPYAEYCTGSAATVNSVCATIGTGGGWFGIGGTSLSSPLWAAVTADRDSYQRAPDREHQPAPVLLADHQPVEVLHRHNRARSAAAGRHQQWPVPDHTWL